MQMRFNRRGQEGFSTTGVLAMIVGVIALVVLGMFIYNAYSKPKEISKLFPDEFQSALAYCGKSLFAGDADQYCVDYKKFDVGSALTTKVYYYNCQDLEIQNGKTNTLCGTPKTDDKYIKRYCIKLAGTSKIDSGSTVYISGVSCKYDAPSTGVGAKLVIAGTQDISTDLINVYPDQAKVA